MGRNGSQSSGSYAVVENCGCFMLQRIAIKRKKNLLLLTAIDSVAPDNWGFRGYLSYFFLMK